MSRPPLRPPTVLDEDLSRALERIAAAQRDLLQPRGGEAGAAGLIDRFARLLPYVLYVFDIRTRRTLYLNRHTASELGWSVEEVARFGDDFTAELLHPDDLARLPQLFGRWEGAPDGTTIETEYRLLAKDGEWRWFRSRDTIFAREPDGAVRLLLGTLEDVTEQRRLRERLAQAQSFEALGRLAGGLAHDFNNYLTALLGAVEAARAALARGESPAPQLDEIAATCRAAGAMTQQLVHFSLGRPTRPERVELSALLHEHATLLRGLLGARVELELVLDAPEAAVWIERPLLVQVLVNLALNARDAMPEGGRFRIAVREESELPPPGLPAGRYVRIEVEDSGHGMDARTLARAFEPFFTTKEAQGGTGLGLATAWGIVLAAGGWIRAESEPGRGARFVLDLPQAEAARHEPHAQPDTERGCAAAETGPRAAQRGRLLLVEDDADVAEVFADALEPLGLEIVRVADAPAALALLAADARGFEALVTDLTLPRGSGLAVARAFRARHAQGALVVVSGWAERSAVGKEPLPADAAFLSKPLSPDELRAALASRLARAGREPRAGTEPGA